MNIQLMNIQSIKDYTYRLPKTGLAQIIGGNSNGKSVLFKAIEGVVLLKITDDDYRDSLISDDSNSGVIVIENDGVALYADLYRERNLCSLSLIRSDSTVIRRFFREGGLDKLIREFGFKVYDKNSLCLQLLSTYGAMPFVNTTYAVNSEIVKDTTEDNTAELFLKNFKEITHPQARSVMRELNKKIDDLQRTKDAIVVYDWRAYTDYNKRLTELYNAVKSFYPVELKKVNVISLPTILDLPRVSLSKVVVISKPACLDVKQVKIRKINVLPKLPKVAVRIPKMRKFPVMRQLPNRVVLGNVAEITKKIREIDNGRCPTCGTKLLDINGECSLC